MTKNFLRDGTFRFPWSATFDDVYPNQLDVEIDELLTTDSVDLGPAWKADGQRTDTDVDLTLNLARVTDSVLTGLPLSARDSQLRIESEAQALDDDETYLRVYQRVPLNVVSHRSELRYVSFWGRATLATGVATRPVRLNAKGSVPAPVLAQSNLRCELTATWQHFVMEVPALSTADTYLDVSLYVLSDFVDNGATRDLQSVGNGQSAIITIAGFAITETFPATDAVYFESDPRDDVLILKTVTVGTSNTDILHDLGAAPTSAWVAHITAVGVKVVSITSTYIRLIASTGGTVDLFFRR